MLVRNENATSKQLIKHLGAEQNEYEKVEMEKGIKNKNDPVKNNEEEIKDMNIKMVFDESNPKAKA